MRDVLRGSEVVHISHGGAGRHGDVLRAVAGDLQLLRRDVLGHGLRGVGSTSSLVPQAGGVGARRRTQLILPE